jgi:hypothetical protein
MTTIDDLRERLAMLHMFDKAKELAGTGQIEMTTCTVKSCGGVMLPSKAIAQTYGGMPDFPGDAKPVTVSAGGPGKLVDCLKCVKCGHSVRFT